MPQVRVNVRTLANTKAVRKEKRNGRDVVIVPSATLPDDIIMNGIKYPAAEISKSFAGLNRTPAPLGHPMINGKFVSARDPEGLNIGYIGAWNENVRRENGRVFLDKVIDVEVANRSQGGKDVLAAIEKGEPVHTSTGLLANLEAVTNAADHKHIARNIEFDHDAILLGEVGAATLTRASACWSTRTASKKKSRSSTPPFKRQSVTSIGRWIPSLEPWRSASGRGSWTN